MLALFRKTVAGYERPRFLVTDHGSIFRSKFKRGLGKKTSLVKGKVRSCQFNGKVERFFRTFKRWCRAAGMLWHPFHVQAHFERFLRYYNLHRTHQALSGLTPECVASGQGPPKARRYLAADPVKPVFRAERIAFEGDHHLPVLKLTVLRSRNLAA